MRPMERLSALLAILLCLAILAACYIEAKKESSNNNNSSNSHGSSVTNPIAGNCQARSPIIGEWSTGSSTPDFLFNPQSRSMYGGGGSGESFVFRNDGTYTSTYVTTGYSSTSFKGWFLNQGKFKVSGNKVTLYDIKMDREDQRNPSKSFRNKPQSGTMTYTFKIEIRETGTVLILKDYTNSSGYTSDSVTVLTKR